MAKFWYFRIIFAKSQDFTIRLSKTLDASLKKTAIVEENVSQKLRKLSDCEKSLDNVLQKCEVFCRNRVKLEFSQKYELNFKNFVANLANFKQELLRNEAEIKNCNNFQQGCAEIKLFSRFLLDSSQSLWETLNIIHERLRKIEKLA